MHKNGIVLLACLFFAPLPGQGTEGREPAAVALLRRAAAAMGVEGMAISTLSGQGIFTDLSGERPQVWEFAVLADGLDRVRWERSDGQRKLVTVVFGDFGWVWDGQSLGRLSLSRTAGRSIEALPVMALNAWIEAPGRRAALLASEESGGRMLDRVEVGRRLENEGAPPGLARAVERSSRKELLLDPQEGLLERLRYFRHNGDWRDDLPVELAFADLRRIQGVLWPHLVTVEVDGRITGQYAFERVEFNADIDPQVFEEPR
ncbi:MAG: hypothetical protein V3T83_10065 [Acidobacteriota bacterium]